MNATVARSAFCGMWKDELCKPCRRSFDDWRESRKAERKPKEAGR
jgi:hypothetical protein